MTGTDVRIGGETPELDQSIIDGYASMELNEMLTYGGLDSPEATMRDFAQAIGAQFGFTKRKLRAIDSTTVLAPASEQADGSLEILRRTRDLFADVSTADQIVAQAQSALVERVRTNQGDDSELLKHITPERTVRSMRRLSGYIGEYLSY